MTDYPTFDIDAWAIPGKRAFEVTKYGAIIHLSQDHLFEMQLKQVDKCRRHKVTSEPNTDPETWARYEAAKAGYAAMEAYEHTEWGGPDYDTEVPEPPQTRTVTYTETKTEWLARLKEAGASPALLAYAEGLYPNE